MVVNWLSVHICSKKIIFSIQKSGIYQKLDIENFPQKSYLSRLTREYVVIKLAGARIFFSKYV